MLLLFAFTLFVSATLLFLLQPMIGKSLLPLLGGTPAVWNTCMVFFQAILLAGYLYAHVSTRWLGARRQALLHIGVLFLPLLSLGLTVHRGLFDYGEGSPIPGLLLALLLSVGLPFFVVSASAPLLQRWFADTGHPAARDPYFLYAASNLGSMLGLFGYPALVEPWLTLANQRLLWRIGYGILALLTAACAWGLWRSAGASGQELVREGPAAPPAEPSPVTAVRRLRWVALAFVPSSLMLGATTYITTDVAPVPLLWVLPLALYLLSFILVFARLPHLIHRFMVVLMPLLVLPLVVLLLWPDFPYLGIGGKVALHMAALFVVAMVCHGELARDRPDVGRLTEFYLWMSVGGVLGGLFNSLLAPVLFNGIVEYPLALVLGCLLMPPEEGEQTAIDAIRGRTLLGFYLGGGLILLLVGLGRTDLTLRGISAAEWYWMAALLAGAFVAVGVITPNDPEEKSARWLDLGLALALGVFAAGLMVGLPIRSVLRGVVRWLPGQSNNRDMLVFHFLAYVLPVVLCYLFVKRPLRFGLGVAALLLAGTVTDLLDADIRLRGRSFFGVLRVSDGGNFRRLEHGTTLHGSQRLLDDEDVLFGAVSLLAATDPLSSASVWAGAVEAVHEPTREALTYFHYTGPIGQVFTAYRHDLARRQVGIIGLGSGTLASYGQRGQRMTYFEIDPLVYAVAYNPVYFTFLQDAKNRGVLLETILGDARLKLEDRARGLRPEDRFGLLIVDAFSSDAIPMHLLTREALKTYLDNLDEKDGILAFHISNRHIDLKPVLANLADALGLVGYVQEDTDESVEGTAASTWVVMARHPDRLHRLIRGGRWELLDPTERPDVGVWSDDFHNLLRVYNW